MKQLHTFDEVFDTQRVFRQLLDAMANPGRRCSIAEEGGKLYGEYPHMLAVAMTLLDGSVSFCTFGQEELAEQMVLLTHARAELPEQADYLFVIDCEKLEQIIANAKMGTLEDPHRSATVLICVPHGQSERHVSLYGPGVDGCMDIMAPEALIRAVKLRDAQNYEYPQGIDLIAQLPGGELMCIPRLVKMEES